jgi:hypothetical protein
MTFTPLWIKLWILCVKGEEACELPHPAPDPHFSAAAFIRAAHRFVNSYFRGKGAEQ